MSNRKLGRTSSQRKAMLRDLTTDLLINGRTTTTEAQADNMNVNALDSMQELPPPPPPNWQYNMSLFALNAHEKSFFRLLKSKTPRHLQIRFSLTCR